MATNVAARLRPLLAQRDFALLLGGQFLAQAADGVAQAALAKVLVLDPLNESTPERILALFAVTLVPYSVFSPFLGVFVDRWPRRRIMVVSNVVRGLLVATVVLWQGAFAGDAELYAAALLLLGLGRLFLTTKGALLPIVVHEKHLLRANAVSGGGGMLAALAGGVLGLSIVTFLSVEAVMAGAGVVYLGAALVTARLSDPFDHDRPEWPFLASMAQVGRELYDGLRQILGHRLARLPLISIFLLRTVGMFAAISAILVIKEQFDTGEQFGRLSASALALGTAGLGALLGALTTPALGRRLHEGGLIVLGFVISGIGLVALGGFVDVFAVSGLTLLGGYGGFVTKVAVDASLQEALPDEYRGRAFAMYDILYNLASVAAGALMVAFFSVSFRLRLGGSGVVTLVLAGLLGLALVRASIPLLGPSETELDASGATATRTTPRPGPAP